MTAAATASPLTPVSGVNVTDDSPTAEQPQSSPGLLNSHQVHYGGRGGAGHVGVGRPPSAEFNHVIQRDIVSDGESVATQ